jgi:uncharacterized membrane protein
LNKASPIFKIEEDYFNRFIEGAEVKTSLQLKPEERTDVILALKKESPGGAILRL